MSDHLVSIIIPAYNAGSSIAQCVQSCLNQTHERLEIIIVNDGSTDDTLDIVKTFSDPRIIIIDQENLGCSQSKNIGLARANGQFIQYLDADDYISADKIHSQVSTIEGRPQTTAVCKTVAVFKSRAPEEIDTELISKGGNGLDFLLRLWGAEGRTGMVQPNAYLISKSLASEIGPWDTSLSPNPDEDGEYFARVLLASKEVHFTHGINYYRKSETDTLSQQIDEQRVLNQLKSIEKTFASILAVKNTKETKGLFARAVSSHVYRHYNLISTILPTAKSMLSEYGINNFKSSPTPYKFYLLSKCTGFEKALKIRKFLMKTASFLRMSQKSVRQ